MSTPNRTSIQVYLTVDQLDTLKRAAAEANRTLSNYVLHAALTAASAAQKEGKK